MGKRAYYKRIKAQLLLGTATTETVANTVVRHKSHRFHPKRVGLRIILNRRSQNTSVKQQFGFIPTPALLFPSKRLF